MLIIPGPTGDDVSVAVFAKAIARIGRLAPGMEADIVAIDLASTPAIAQRTAGAGDFWEALFPTIMMGDDRAIRAVWVGGQRRD